MKIDLAPDQLELVKTILNRSLPEGTQVRVFGSRAKGTARKFSDLDLALDFHGKELSPSIMSDLVHDFEHSFLPFKVDVVDLNGISDSFKKNIEKDLVELV